MLVGSRGSRSVPAPDRERSAPRGDHRFAHVILAIHITDRIVRTLTSYHAGVGRMMSRSGIGTALAMALTSAEADAAVVGGRILAIEGDVSPGAQATVTDVLQPFVDPVGQVAFAGTLTGGAAFLFVDDQVRWLSTDEAAVVTSVQSSVGTLAAADFVLRATIDGELGLWTHLGALARAGDAAPGFPLFPTTAFVGPGDCTIDGTGAMYWRATVDITNDGSADVSGLFRAPDGPAGSIEAVYRSGSLVDGVTLHGGTSAVTDELSVSDDGAHLVARLTAAGDSLADHLVVLDGQIIAREGDVVPSFPLEQWRAIDLVSVNDAGHVLFTGNTDAAAGVDEFVAYDGDIVVHEGDVLDGVGLDFDLRFVALNDRNNAAIGWATNDGGPTNEVVFFACDAADIAGTAELLVTTGDTLDVDADAIGDFTIADIVGTGTEGSQVLGDAYSVYLEVDLDPDDRNAIIEIPITCCGNGVTNGGEECDDGNDIDDDDCTNGCLLAPEVGTSSSSGSSSSSSSGSSSGSGSSGDPGSSSESTDDGTTSSSSTESTSTESSSSGSSSTESTSTGADATSSGDDSTSTSASTGGSSSEDPSTGSLDTSTDASDESTSGTTSGSTGMPTTSEAESESSGADASVDSGCGCATSPSHGTLLALGLVVLGGPRRRRSA